MNARPLHSYPRYFQDWLLSETRSRLNLQERGLFGDLCDLMATDGGSLIDDEATLQRRAACTAREWRNAWPKVRQCFEARDGRLSNFKLTYALENAAKSFDARSKGGKATAELRWGGSSANSSASAQQVADGIAERLPSVPPPPPFPLRSEEHPLPPQGDVLVLAAPEPKQRVRKAKAEAIPESPEFVEFYRIYPRHVGRGPAWLAWQHHVHNGDAAKVIAGLKAAIPALNRAEEDKRPHPSTWLDQERWRDCEGLNGTAPRSSLQFHTAKPKDPNAEDYHFAITKEEGK